MATIVCPDCKKQVSELATACPHCGRPVSKADVDAARKAAGETSRGCAWGCLAVVVIGAVIAAFVALSSDNTKTTASAGSNLDVPKTTRAGFAACTSLESTKRVVELARDRRAYALYIADPTNGCALLKPGLSVIVEDYAMGGYVKIRKEADPNSMWVVKEAVGIP